MDIDDWRKRIDEIDTKILELLNERITCVTKIAEIKNQRGIPVFVAEREKKIMERLLKQNKGPLEEINIRNIFSMIFTESKRVQGKYCKE